MQTKVLTVILTGWLALTSLAGAAVEVVTAKQALAKANASVEGPVRDLLIMLKGYESDTLLRPRVWDITLYDPTRPNNAAVVRVKDSAAVNVASGIRLLDGALWKNFSRNFSGYAAAEVIDLRRWAQDSDRVIARTVSHPKLAGVEVTAVRLLLRKPSDGDVPPLWQIEVSARLINEPRQDKWIGYLQISADSGELITDELHPEKLRR
jgi:hypothetical protein